MSSICGPHIWYECDNWPTVLSDIFIPIRRVPVQSSASICLLRRVFNTKLQAQTTKIDLWSLMISWSLSIISGQPQRLNNQRHHQITLSSCHSSSTAWKDAVVVAQDKGRWCRIVLDQYDEDERPSCNNLDDAVELYNKFITAWSLLFHETSEWWTHCQNIFQHDSQQWYVSISLPLSFLLIVVVYCMYHLYDWCF